MTAGGTLAVIVLAVFVTYLLWRPKALPEEIALTERRGRAGGRMEG
jgi:hypothetical protein